MMPWLTETLVSSTLLMLLVMALRRPVAKAFGARVAYALWLLPALRMILPPLPGHRALYLPVMRLAPDAPVQVGLVSPDMPGDPVTLPPELASLLDPAPHAAAWSFSAVLLTLWLAGAACWLGWQMLRYRRFVARALDGATPLGSECRVDVLLSDHVEGPVASGVLHRRIFLPRDFTTRYTSAERRQALLHEGAHHDRHDLLANLIGLAVLACHWWNPLAHLAHRAFRSDQELACDATVLAQADAADRYAYGSALVKSACARTPAAACALDPATEIKRRLRMIGRARLPLPLRVAGALMAAGAIGGGLVATASSGTIPAAAREIAEPIAPVPPVAPIAPIPAIPVAPAPPRPPHVHHRSAEAADAGRLAAEDARLAGEQARHAGEMARIAGERARIAGERARHDALASVDVPALTRASLDQTRASLVAQCAARGHPVRPGEQDWSQLAMCDKAAFRAEIRNALEIARAEISRNATLTRAQADMARHAIEAARRGMDAHID